MFNILSIIFKYIFIIIIYIFLYSIIKLIYLDIRGLSFISSDNEFYLKVLNNLDDIPYLLKEYYLLNRDINIGRGINNDIIIANPYVSKNHLQISREGGKIYIEDLRSSNGTYLNNKKIYGKTELKTKDIFKVGDITFQLNGR